MFRLIPASVLALSLIRPGIGFAQLAATATTLAISAAGTPVSSVTPGTVVTLTATVLAGTTLKTVGQIKFCDADAAFCTDIHLLATAQLTAAGSATFKFVPGVGTHHYKAVFPGTHTVRAPAGGSESAPATLSVAAAGSATSTTTIVSSGGPGNYTLTATVTGSATAAATGTVSFLDTTNANFVLGTAGLGVAASGLSLQQASILPTGLNPTSIVTADFNGDGIPDIATANEDSLGAFVPGSITILLGKGDGTFTAAPSVATGIFPAALVTADFNGDGIPDLAFTTTISGNLNIVLGNGDGTFTALPSPIVGSFGAFYGLAVGDVNNDGNVDLVATDVQNKTVLILLGNGDGTFNPLDQQPATGDNPVGIVLGDFNNDGNLDLAIDNLFPTGNGPNTLTILLGGGDGSFGAVAPATVGTRPAGIVSADFNGDGKLDLAVVDVLAETIEVLLGNGDGTFAIPLVTGGFDHLHSITVGDFNGDGRPDLVAFVADIPAPPFQPANLFTLIGNGDGTFTTGATALDPNYPNSGAVADFNGDGRSDIASESPNATGSVTVYLSEFSGAATASVTNISPVGTGTHFVDAQYSGDANYAASISATVPLTALPVPTTLALTAAPAAGSTFGQSVTLTAFLNPNTAQNHDATGIVTFLSDGTVVGTGPLAAGTAILNTATLPAGVDTLTATYPGDTNFLASTSAPLPFTVTSTATKSQTITFPQPASPLPFGAPPVTLVATATSGLPITFKLISGPATLTGTLLAFTGAGTVVVAADQSGNATYAPAPEVTRSVIVTPPASVTLTAAPTLVFLLNPVTLTAAISVTGAPAGGTVTFLDGTQPIASSAPQSGTATIVLATLPLGPHTITASWSGDATHAPQSSAPTLVTVEDFSLAFTSPQLTIVHGGTATYTLQLTPVGGPAIAAPIAVSLAGQPTGSEITLTPATVPPGAPTATVTIVIATPNYPTGPFAHNGGGDPHGTSKIFLALLLSGALLLPFRRAAANLRTRTPWNSALLAIATATLILGAIGCGSGWSTETFQIQATAASGPLSHTTTATLTSKCSNGQPACPVVGK